MVKNKKQLSNNVTWEKEARVKGKKTPTVLYSKQYNCHLTQIFLKGYCLQVILVAYLCH